MHKYRHYLIDNTIFSRKKTILLAKSVQKLLNRGCVIIATR
jgi:hypothetical protein